MRELRRTLLDIERQALHKDGEVMKLKAQLQDERCRAAEGLRPHLPPLLLDPRDQGGLIWVGHPAWLGRLCWQSGRLVPTPPVWAEIGNTVSKECRGWKWEVPPRVRSLS